MSEESQSTRPDSGAVSKNDRVAPQRGKRRSAPVAGQARKPQIGDSAPAPTSNSPGGSSPRASQKPKPESSNQGGEARKRRRGSRGGRRHKKPSDQAAQTPGVELPDPPAEGRVSGEANRRSTVVPVDSSASPSGVEKKSTSGEPKAPKKRRRTRKPKSPVGHRDAQGRATGRYMMCVSSRDGVNQVAVLEGRRLIEHYVFKDEDDPTQIDGNIYLGRVQNVLPGMEAAFVDIATPKNAVLYRGDVRYDPDDLVESNPNNARIEQLLKNRQLVVCQVTKNPIAAKGARLTQEVSLPGRFAVLIPNSKTYGISKRLPDTERRRLRKILDEIKPAEHGVIVRTAAKGAAQEDLIADMRHLLMTWQEVDNASKKAKGPKLLYREPNLALRIIREEFNADFRAVVCDSRKIFDEVSRYVRSISPGLADRIDYYDAAAESLPLFERYHVHEQLHKAVDRKVWLQSGGSLIIERTEALTVIDVNTGKNVGSSGGTLEDTVFQNNLEAAREIASQLRLRDIGGIIVVDFIDMEVERNRKKVIEAFKEALAADKTKTQVFDISELGLVQMTRKRISEGLVESLSTVCSCCEGRGLVLDQALL